MIRRLWLMAAVACAMWIFQVTAFPQTSETLSVEDVRRPVYRGNHRTRESKSELTETISSTTATPIGESLRAVTKQLLQPTDMVATDVRTPPRVKNKTGEAKIEKLVDGPLKTDRIGEGVGEAIAVDVITQAPGLSTWILLSNDQVKGRPATQATIQSVEKQVKKNDTLKIKPVSNKTPIKKQNSTDEVTKSPLILQDVKFKNRTPVVVGRVPTTPLDNQTRTTITIAVTSPTPVNKTKPSLSSQSTKFVEIVPTTSLVLETDTIETGDEISTTETTTTTKRTRRPSTKKKKKNKNRRRRPSKPEETAESKITQDNNLVSNKIDPSRPITTRIYNYLAREVMPTVGVGIVGLVLTAGLAGLFLYPFGGGIARRNYEKGTGHQHHYYYNDYVPHREDHTKPAEDKIFNPISPSLNHNSYMSSYDSKYNNKFRYESDYSQPVNGYAGSSEYSTLPDSVKNSDFSLTDSNKYYSMDPVSSQYKLTDIDKYKDEGNYPSFTEYTSYTNAASVGTRGSYEKVEVSQNDTKEEDKSDKSQPEFSALVGTPQFTNTDFVGSVSLTGSYGTDTQRTGALASEHGPRALRNTRDVHDDFNNEIDVTDEKILKQSPIIPSTEISKVEVTTEEKTTVTDVSTESPSPDETTTQFNFMNMFTEENEKEPPPQNSSFDNPGGFIGFIKRLAQLKLKIGISLLRSTSEVVQKYFDNVAARMEEAVRHLEKRRRSLLFPSSSRSKRNVTSKKNIYRKLKKID
ncbi:uncharacterized protein [Halyomorpha halys]|uniref:uncharacterized protein n=1 Tax=Halyomorpha halys TaxID=286706 RepID=UPI0006D523A2|nr:uncharacterized protein LOC106689161 [Halyomorpha halys]XP_014289503.1 uncharacterized protein LOC106689161 [Halyomorpha halys]XP_014289504.1 uncharacterized protein LOC106689161 [Halyomorpha halys]